MPEPIGYEWVVEAFWTLSTCRPIGMAAGPIPWTAIQHYAEVERLGAHSTWLLHQLVRHMDGVWMEVTLEESKRASDRASSRRAGQAKPGAPKPRGRA